MKDCIPGVVLSWTDPCLKASTLRYGQLKAFGEISREINVTLTALVVYESTFDDMSVPVWTSRPPCIINPGCSVPYTASVSLRIGELALAYRETLSWQFLDIVAWLNKSKKKTLDVVGFNLYPLLILVECSRNWIRFSRKRTFLSWKWWEHDFRRLSTWKGFICIFSSLGNNDSYLWLIYVQYFLSISFVQFIYSYLSCFE